MCAKLCHRYDILSVWSTASQVDEAGGALGEHADEARRDSAADEGIPAVMAGELDLEEIAHKGSAGHGRKFMFVAKNGEWAVNEALAETKGRRKMGVTKTEDERSEGRKGDFDPSFTTDADERFTGEQANTRPAAMEQFEAASAAMEIED